MEIKEKREERNRKWKGKRILIGREERGKEWEAERNKKERKGMMRGTKK